MTSQARQLLEQVLALPEADRVLLVEALQDSLESVESQDAVDAAWGEEIERRMRTIQDGTAVLLDGDDVMRQLKSKFGI